jgi:hypothetical protein
LAIIYVAIPATTAVKGRIKTNQAQGSRYQDVFIKIAYNISGVLPEIIPFFLTGS